MYKNAVIKRQSGFAATLNHRSHLLAFSQFIIIIIIITIIIIIIIININNNNINKYIPSHPQSQNCILLHLSFYTNYCTTILFTATCFG
jgi:hypothetical protein